MGAQLRERYEAAQADGEGDSFSSWVHFVPVDHAHYSARRRAQRLSYAVWGVIGVATDDAVQPLLEVGSTSDRLRRALVRMREIMQQIG